MTRRFCVLCGKATDELIQNICGDCYIKEKSILHLPENIRGEICGNCGAHRNHGHWIEPEAEAEDAILRAAEEALNESMKVEVDDPRVQVNSGPVKKSSDKLFLVPFQVSVKGEVEGFSVESKGSSTVEVRVGICDDCTRRRGGYFEAVLQVRGENGLDENLRTQVSEMVEDSLRRGREKRGFLTKVDELPSGIDYYLGSIKMAKRIAKAIRERYGGRITESPKLVGRKQGKDIYRVNIAVRLPKRSVK